MTDHSKIIEDLGGNRIVAEYLGVPTVYVRKWKRRGIPWKHRWKLAVFATGSRVQLPEDFLEC